MLPSEVVETMALCKSMYEKAVGMYNYPHRVSRMWEIEVENHGTEENVLFRQQIFHRGALEAETEERSSFSNER
jgi:hypothetical protein